MAKNHYWSNLMPNTFPSPSNISYGTEGAPGFYLPASSFQNIYVASLTENSSGIWGTANSLPSNQLNLSIGLSRNATKRPIYLWDLHVLSDIIGQKASGIKTWHPIWVTKFKDEAGQGVYRSLETVFQVNPFNQTTPNKHIYTASLDTHPLYIESVEASTATNIDAWTILRQATLIPAFPLLFTSSIPNGQHYGPHFIKNISFSVSGHGSAGAVQVSAQFEGGKSIQSPLYTSSTTNLQSSGDSIPQATVIKSNGVSYPDYIAYRAASIFDCIADINTGFIYYTNIADFQKNATISPLNSFNTEGISPTRRLIEMNLSVSQSFNYKFRSDTKRKDSDGPRFASLESREVSGSLQFFSPTQNLGPLTESSLTLYFGGPFLFAMPIVNWQPSILDAQTEDGYIYTYNFIAQAANPGSKAQPNIPTSSGNAAAPIVYNPSYHANALISEFAVLST